MRPQTYAGSLAGCRLVAIIELLFAPTTVPFQCLVGTSAIVGEHEQL
jgi:hypothetical protein